ncbi:NUDIX domain-containing protein [Pontibacillus yanchengensis]|uniref:NUDIX domain-containing protein n=2 Tax=Pontibacillus yanchengensis TaxID=462910 RepID=A0ACC7VDS8_9BACI|nr:NUDIX domain-containing protein [Pontibacillus yanchengensis]MYL32480.1 NUDIX domain-containing protein [Pontibacillus yanchengensis]MYL53061.1 NUDIX domain-containing protein [Pontibacillus yanchengensis]
MKRKQKILAYITRVRNGQHELLVHKHKHQPEAGIQVVSGTVETGESLETTLFREILEEAGLKRIKLKKFLNTYTYYHPTKHKELERNVFWLEVTDQVPDEWEHEVEGSGNDKGLIFCWSWVPLHHHIELAANHDDCLHLIR